MDNRTKKTNNKRFVRYPEGAEMYSMSLSKFQQLAKDAKACYKMNRLVLVNLDILFVILFLYHLFYKPSFLLSQKEKSLHYFWSAISFSNTAILTTCVIVML